MDELIVLLLALTKNEFLQLVSTYKQQSNTGDGKKKQQLIQAIRLKKITTDTEAALLIGMLANSTYRKLRSEIKKDIHNLLLSTTYAISAKTNFKEALYQCRKLSTVGYNLYTRNALSAANVTLREALDIAEKYEFTQDALLINGLLQTITASITEFRKYKTWKNKKVELLQKELLAFDTYYDITLPHIAKKNKEHLFSIHHQSFIQILSKLFSKTKSSNISYFYYRASINNELINQNFAPALRLSKELLNLVKNKPGVYSEERVSSANILIAICHLELKQYKEAEHTANETIDVITKEHINWLIALNLLFAVYIAERKLSEATEILQKALKSKLVITDSFQEAKWGYYEANLYFLKHDYKRCLQILARYSEIAKDKTGWYLGFRLLELLCHIELADFEFVAIKLNSFKQFLKRNHSINLHRYRSIHKLLASLHAHEYNYAKTYSKHQLLITELEQASGAFYRDPMAFELITVEKWLVDKLAQLPQKKS